MTAEDVLAVIREAVATVLEVPAASVLPAQRLAEDLAVDSLALVEIVDIVEQELVRTHPRFGFDDPDLDRLDTVQDVVDYCQARLAR